MEVNLALLMLHSYQTGDLKHQFESDINCVGHPVGEQSSLTALKYVVSGAAKHSENAAWELLTLPHSWLFNLLNESKPLDTELL